MTQVEAGWGIGEEVPPGPMWQPAIMTHGSEIRVGAMLQITFTVLAGIVDATFNIVEFISQLFFTPNSPYHGALSSLASSGNAIAANDNTYTLGCGGSCLFMTFFVHLSQSLCFPLYLNSIFDQVFLGYRLERFSGVFS